MLQTSRRSKSPSGRSSSKTLSRLLKALLRKCRERNTKATWQKDRSKPAMVRLQEEMQAISLQNDRLEEEACDLRQRLADCHETIEQQGRHIDFLEFQRDSAYAHLEVLINGDLPTPSASAQAA